MLQLVEIPGNQDQQDGGTIQRAQKIFQELARGLVHPVQIIKDQHGGGQARLSQQQHAQRQVGLPLEHGRFQQAQAHLQQRLAGQQAQHLQQVGQDVVLLQAKLFEMPAQGFFLGDGCIQLGQAQDIADQAGDDVVRGNAHVGCTGALENIHLRPLDLLAELGQQASFADAGLAGDQDGTPVRDPAHAVKGIAEHLQILLAAHQGCLQVGKTAQRAGPDAYGERLEGRHIIVDPLQHQGRHNLIVEKQARALVGAKADQDRARLGRLFQARGQVHRIANHGVFRVMLVAQVTGNHRAGVQADAQVELVIVTVLQQGADLQHAGLHLQGSPHGPFGIIFVVEGQAKQGHQAITGKLINRAFIAVDHIGEHVHDFIDRQVKLFAVQGLRSRGEIGDIDEQNGNFPALAHRCG